jgi:hypothetical protein
VTCAFLSADGNIPVANEMFAKVAIRGAIVSFSLPKIQVNTQITA